MCEPIQMQRPVGFEPVRMQRSVSFASLHDIGSPIRGGRVDQSSINEISKKKTRHYFKDRKRQSTVLVDYKPLMGDNGQR